MSLDEAVFLLSLFATVAATGLIWYGRRGRLVGGHLHCEHCGHDLFGQPIGTARCPECGRLIRYGRPRGRREPAGRMIYIGAAILPLALLGLSITTVTRIRKVRWIEHEPFWYVLQVVSRSVLDQNGEHHLDELERRRSAGKLSTAELKRTAVVLLTYQTDTGRAWSPQIGFLIEQFRGAALLSNPQWEDYLASGFGASMAVDRVNTVLDGDIYGVLTVKGVRYGPWRGEAVVWVGSAQIDGEVAGTGVGSMRFALHQTSEASVPFRILMSDRLTQGRHELEIEYEAAVTDTSGAASTTTSRRYRARAHFEVEAYVAPAD